MCFICMIIKRYQLFLENFVNHKIGACDESPPKMRTVPETLLGDFTLVRTFTIISHGLSVTIRRMNHVGIKIKVLVWPKNNYIVKSIYYNVWNQNIAKLSLTFYELYRFEEAQYDETFMRHERYIKLI